MVKLENVISVFDNNKFVTSIKSINVVIHNIFESTTCSILIEGCCETSSFGNMLFAFFRADDNNNLCLPRNILRIYDTFLIFNFKKKISCKQMCDYKIHKKENNNLSGWNVDEITKVSNNLSVLSY